MNRMSLDLQTRLASIDWSSVEVTRGSGEIVPDLILKLDSEDMNVALHGPSAGPHSTQAATPCLPPC